MVKTKAYQQYLGLKYSIRLVRDNREKYTPVMFRNSVQVYNFIKHLSERDKETLVAICLNVRNCIIGIDEVSSGSVIGLTVEAKDLFKLAILKNSVSIILAHNHPSSDTAPSESDILFTSKILKAGEIMGIKILDHIIVGASDYYSFADHDQIF